MGLEVMAWLEAQRGTAAATVLIGLSAGACPFFGWND
jgi:hypothetical protein